MAVSVAHPRRRSQVGAASQVPSALDALRKSETFNARTRISTELVTPFEAASLMPKRSPTNPKSLEELLAEGENHVEYISKLLRDFNLAWKSDKPLAADASILNDREVHAVPTLSQPIDIANDKLATASREHHHDSDSGLGTSVDTIVDEKELVARFIPSRSPARTPHTSHFFSKASVQQIKKHIVQPILDEPALKEFHPLIEDIPARIGRKFITNLRDLEKTLLFLAPDYASSPAKFLQFCETSIECLQTTVDLISERDQRKPTDRPYTNNYFVDLVDQIRRYAEIMRHTREKKERGEPLDEMDYSPDEEVAISGGLSQNGRPAELIRTKNGKAIALSNNTIIDDMEEGTSSKRPLTDADLDEDEIFRSMARRRKSEKPGDVVHICRACDKEFKRPCDLTKHEKTHSRPWKCDESTCKYHTLGWPTEKEMQRHWNDKHSLAPHLYKCEFPPCTYSSKRESNCKQHMEKTHAWEYKKSKHNGRKKAPQTSGSPFTPLTPFMSTPASYNTHLITPQEPFAASPALPFMATPFDAFNFNQFPPTPTMSIGGARRDSTATNSAHSVGTYSSNFVSPQQVVAQSFEEIMGSGDTMLDQSLNMLVPPPMFQQQPTPAVSVNNHFGTDWLGFSKASPVDALAQPGTLEYSMVNPPSDGPSNLASPPSVNFEETVNFDDAIAGADLGDFQLYGSPAPGEAGPSNYHQHTWFPETSDVINNQFDEWGNYIGPGFDHVL